MSSSQNQENESTSEYPIRANYEYPSLEDYEENDLMARNTKSLDRMDHSLDLIAQSLVHLAEAGRLTTQPSAPAEQLRQANVTAPQSEIPVGANNDVVQLGDGRSVPTSVIRALDEYDTATWPGALLPEARAAVAHVVINVVEADKEPVLRTKYPFCLDPNPGGLTYESPCILRADHPGKHADNNDGVW